MNQKKILVGVVAATVLNVASAANPLVVEKQQQAQVMNKLLDGLTVVMKAPECTLKTVIASPL